ncbi:class I SAM-dependent methyltransferase [Persicobacter sp. CCB-QB2]|uniref:class I SAM-dependent DNA methyltransferase n=1 Tax=Persicobacter sp. CCB-QB2 TaxID=1561025 RepID=UPI0006A9CFBC|nr:class I SAM-dependent methyltransferase [Persicobacter sp. CCB-QB2]
MTTKKEWFGEWFDSPYYHILYKDRDYTEAQQFISRLVEKLAFPKQAKVMDLACGKGRHSIYLNKLGFDVVGLDLSAQNVEAARQSGNSHLHFYIHDMRKVFAEGVKQFDYVLNLFTSFGYFAEEQQNQQAIESAAQALKKGGVFVLDFLNPEKVISNLVGRERKTVEEINFCITRQVDDQNFIVKDIWFEDENRPFHFQERVKAISKKEFIQYFEAAGLEVQQVYGDYYLNEYDAQKSDRMIFVARRP